LDNAKAEFQQLERDSVMCHSDRPWGTPLHMMENPDAPWWLSTPSPALQTILDFMYFQK
jgi:hypothetical protein